MYNEDFLKQRLEKRIQQNIFRQLPTLDKNSKIDFSSNDYLGIATKGIQNILPTSNTLGSTGSRLISGNHYYYQKLEQFLSHTHRVESSLVFNSGYDANIGLLSCIGHREDTYIYDEWCHASIRDGIQLSLTKKYSYRHNDLEDLEKKICLSKGKVFVITESIFSMDGDEVPLQKLINLCKQYNAYLILDEAHSLGWYGRDGLGMANHLEVEKNIFARILTFGKALGYHGSAILGSKILTDYLINFARSFIYTTALPQESIKHILHNYSIMKQMHEQRQHLQKLINYFQQQDFGIKTLKSTSPIQGLVIPNNEKIRSLAKFLNENHFFCFPILYPTIPKNSERIRITLHAFNTFEEIRSLAQKCQEWVSHNPL